MNYQLYYCRSGFSLDLYMNTLQTKFAMLRSELGFFAACMRERRFEYGNACHCENAYATSHACLIFIFIFLNKGMSYFLLIPSFFKIFFNYVFLISNLG